MAPNQHTDPASDRPARAIRARRSYLGKTQEQLVDESNGELYPRFLSELENGVRKLEDLRLPKLLTLLRVLEWSGDDFVRETGIELPVAAPIPGAAPYEPSFAAPQFGSVAAGITDGGEPDPGQKPFLLDPDLPWIRGRDLSRLVVMTVNGDSMVSPKAAESIPHGSKVVVERGAIPTDKDIIVAWIDDLGVSVLKEYDEGQEVVLRSLNPRGPVFRAGEHEIDIRGVVRYVMFRPS